MIKKCQNCGEHQTALKNHIRLSSGDGHGPSGTYPDGFEDRNSVTPDAAGQETDARTSPEYAGAESDAPDPIGDALDGWEPDTQANPRTARAQTRRVAEHLRSVGEYRRKSELVDALAGDSTLGRRTW